ncbi:hypothetical protein Ait01nite_014030 [Actinoplanes italicus]|nr:hypothetical protein Ait01nite_014030 [Actinoplanes italicus]
MWDRLDALPRDDAVWALAKLRTTRSKVYEYARQCLDRDPADATARWTLIGSEMEAGRFGALDLIASDPAGSPYDLIAVAEWVWLEMGLPACPHVERALRHMNPPPADDRAGKAIARFRTGRSFSDSIGRYRWSVLQNALISSADGTEARELLQADPSAVDDLRDAARWWARYRDTDVSARLDELRAGAS